MSNQQLRDWLTANVPGLTFYPGPDLADDPNPHCVVAYPLPGAGFSTEMVLDSPAVQLRVVGEQGDFASAEQLAWALDTFMVGGPYPTFVDGVRVVGVDRTGGGPTPLGLDSADRDPFVCTYLVHQSSNVVALR